jgi:hypothetical protein
MYLKLIDIILIANNLKISQYLVIFKLIYDAENEKLLMYKYNPISFLIHTFYRDR